MTLHSDLEFLVSKVSTLLCHFQCKLKLNLMRSQNQDRMSFGWSQSC